jgi:D-alanine-D-alanine ligase
VAKTLPELAQMLEQAVSGDEEVMVEQWIFGREATGAVIENFRNKELYPLLPIEIQKSPNDVFDYDTKYNGTAREVIGGSLSESEKRTVEELAALIHKELGLRHYSRSDFIITPRGEVYFIEVNSLPGLTSESLIPKALSAVGMSFPNFIDHILELTLNEQ